MRNLGIADITEETRNKRILWKWLKILECYCSVESSPISVFNEHFVLLHYKFYLV